MNRVVCPKCYSVAMVRSLSNPKYMRCGVCDLMVKDLNNDKDEEVDDDDMREVPVSNEANYKW